MRKLLFILSLIGGLLSVPTNLMADEGQKKKTIRMFLNTGEQLDFDANVIDSMTFTSDAQTIWYDDTCRTVAIEVIDSIWYMTPTLRLTTQSLDFGKVAVGNKKTGFITLTNTGQFVENFFLLANGVFSAPLSGRNFKIAVGESQSVELSFEPEDSITYNGNLFLQSNAFQNGSYSFPLIGEGVGIDSLEEDVILPPVEEEFELVLPNEQDPESLAGFKIMNSYGEFPISMSAASAARRAAKDEGESDYHLNVNALVSQNWMQAHFLADGQSNPYLFVITMPGEKPKMTPEQTAISLLMSEPLLVTTNEDEYRNTVQSIKNCKEEWNAYLAEIKRMYYNGINAGLCPDYSLIDTKPILKALSRKLFDNSELTLSGVSLVDKDIDTKNGKATFKVHNDLRRTLHIYPSRVRINDNSGAIIAREDISPTLTDKIVEWLEAYVKEKKNVEELSDEDIENMNELKEMVDELETLVTSTITNGKVSHVHLPIELDSQHSNYWKIVKGPWNGDTSSPFAITSDPIEITYEDYDKALIDVYGLGTFNKPWDNYTGEEQLRIIFALLYGGYKDFIKPAMDIAAGVNSLKESMAKAQKDGVGSYKYDLRYGSRKYPLLMLVVRLGIDLLTEGQDTYKKVKKDLKEGDKLEAARDILEFLYDRICVKPKDESTSSKRSYYNLIYNCYKNITNDPKKSKEFRENFKAVANNLNVLKKAGFIGKVVSLSELGLDVIGTIDAVRLSQVQETFIVNKSREPYINIVKPEQTSTNPKQTIYFEWYTYKGDLTTPFLYDLEMMIDTPDEFKTVVVKAGIEGNSYEYDLSKLPNVTKAKRVYCRVVARHPNSNSVIVMSDPKVVITNLGSIIPTFVDLGLPSGTQWANRNMGANQGVEIGGYYAWGETTDKTVFSWKNYKYSGNDSNNSDKLTKYCSKSSYGNKGFTDNLTELQGSDDISSSRWGYNYSIPTKEEWEELMIHCNWQWYDDGVWVSSKTDPTKGIWLPAAGYCNGYDCYDKGSEGHYWSSTLDTSSPDDAWYMDFSRGKTCLSSYYRYQGRSIRPVLHKVDIISPAGGN